RQIVGAAAHPHPAHRDARAAQLGDPVPQELARLDGVEEYGEGTQLEADRGEEGEMVGDARQFPGEDADVLGALWYVKSDELLDAHHVADVVEVRRDVV